MATHEAWIQDKKDEFMHIATNRQRIIGEVSIGISRLPIVLIVWYLFAGYSIKDVKKRYPQIEVDDLRVISRLRKDLKHYGFIIKKS